MRLKEKDQYLKNHAQCMKHISESPLKKFRLLILHNTGHLTKGGVEEDIFLKLFYVVILMSVAVLFITLLYFSVIINKINCTRRICKVLFRLLCLIYIKI